MRVLCRERYDLLVAAAIFCIFVSSFNAGSPIHGPIEVFDQDTTYILDSLERGEPYQWNPQNHILFHYVVDRGFELWRNLMPIPEYASGRYGAYLFLKCFAAACGLAFLAALSWLLSGMGLPVGARAALVALAGFSATSWFNFSSFETHALAAPFLCVYLLVVDRISRGDYTGWRDRSLLIVSLVTMSLVRIDLFRFALVSGLLLFLPNVSRRRKAILVDLACVAAATFVLQSVLVSAYLSDSDTFVESVTEPFNREDRASLSSITATTENFTVENFIRVARAVGIYSVLMPARVPQSGEVTSEWPPYGAQGFDESVPAPDNPMLGLFSAPLRNFLFYPSAILAVLAVVGLLAAAWMQSFRQALRGNVREVLVASQWLVGWVMYTWFNPWEPFLWTLEFVPLHMVVIAGLLSVRRVLIGVVAAVAVLVALHNWVFFYQPFA